jgi:hypothetical protein
MELELADYNEDRTRQFTLLLDKQRRELSHIDSEITNLGINVADLAETMQDIHFFAANAAIQLAPHDRQILSTKSNNNNNNNRASMISLQRSYSSNSFVSNTTNGSGSTTHK